MKILIYTSFAPPDFKDKKVFGDDIALELEKLPPLFPKPAQPDYSCRRCGALSFVPVDVCDECLKPDPEPPPPLDYSCQRCGIFAFIQIDLCDDCLKAEKKKKRKCKKSRRKRKVAKEPEKPKFEKLTVKEVEQKKRVLNRAHRGCMKFHFGPDAESATDKETRLAKLKKLQAKHEYLSGLIGYNIELYLSSPKPNIYKRRVYHADKN